MKYKRRSNKNNRRSRELYGKCKINDVTVDFLADTGAEVSLISESTLNRTGSHIDRAQTAYTLEDASCNKMKLIGETNVKLQMGDTISYKSIPVVKNLQKSCLIGRDILSTCDETKKVYNEFEKVIHDITKVVENDNNEKRIEKANKTNTHSNCFCISHLKCETSDYADKITSYRNHSREPLLDIDVVNLNYGEDETLEYLQSDLESHDFQQNIYVVDHQEEDDIMSMNRRSDLISHYSQHTDSNSNANDELMLENERSDFISQDFQQSMNCNAVKNDEVMSENIRSDRVLHDFLHSNIDDIDNDIEELACLARMAAGYLKCANNSEEFNAPKIIETNQHVEILVIACVDDDNIIEQEDVDLSPETLLAYKDLTREQAEVIIKEMCEKISVEKLNQLTRSNNVMHEIKVINETPIRQKPRRIPYHKQKELREMLQEMLEAGIIKESNSPWRSPIKLVSKSDGSLRITIDFRKLNKVTVKDAYSLPDTWELISKLSKSRYFTKLDYKSGYFQIRLHPDSCKYTAFAFGNSLYEYDAMAMGLTNATATFQRAMDKMLARFIDKFV
jgi:hypothetical protein